ncbi:MAG: hypothetical protein ACTSV6_03225, partial [Candidatus Heimdallarchaeota archaeon]
MKKVFLLLIFICMFIGNVALADNSLTVNWQVLSTKIRPGSSTTVLLTLTNPSLTTGINSVKIYISPGPYLSVSTNYQEIGGIGAGSSQQTSFSVSAHNNAISSDSYVTVRVTYYSDSTQKETSVNIPIAIRRIPILQITNVSYDKEIIEPGTGVKVAVEISNYGDGAARDVRIILNESQNIFTAVGSGENYISFI